MKGRDHCRSAAAAFAALAVVAGLAACGSSDAGVSTAVTVPAAVAATTTAPPTALSAPTTNPATTDPAPSDTHASTTTDNVLLVSEDEVADLEKQLDEIDQLLTGVDADLSHD